MNRSAFAIFGLVVLAVVIVALFYSVSLSINLGLVGTSVGLIFAVFRLHQRKVLDWKEGASDTASLFLAAVAAIWEAELLATNPLLLTEIGVLADIVILLALRITSRYWKSGTIRFAKWLYQGLAWVTAVIAGNLFTYGYALAVAYPKIGIIGPLWLVVFLLLVLIMVAVMKRQQVRAKNALDQSCKK